MRSSNTLEALRLALDQQTALTARVRARLAADATSHLLAASISGTELVLYVDSPVWATQLRLQGTSLLRSLNDRQMTARNVRTRVVAPTRAHPCKAAPTLSQRARVALTEAAEGTTDHALKASLLRLSRVRQKQMSHRDGE